MSNYTEIRGFSLLHKRIGGYQDFFEACTGIDCTSFKKFSDLNDLLPGKNLRRLPKAGKMALHAAALALDDAGIKLPIADELSQKIGIYLASAHGPVGSSFAFNDSVLEDGPKCASPTDFSYSVNNIYASLLSIHLNIRGSLCSSSQFLLSMAGALQAASTALLIGEVDYALLGVVEEAHPLLDAAYSAGTNENNSLREFIKTSSEECAIFFCLQRQTARPRLLISIPTWTPSAPSFTGPPSFTGLTSFTGPTCSEQGQPPRGVDLCLKSGALEDGMDCEPLLKRRKLCYGNTAAVHALNMALAAGLLRQSTLPAYSDIKKIACEVLDPLTNSFAGVTLLRADDSDYFKCKVPVR